MKTNITFGFLVVLLLLIPGLIISQTTADFDSFQIPEESALNGSDENGGFQDGHIFLPNDYDANYDFWSGWAISNSTDTTTAGFLNQYSSIVGSGYASSSNFAVGYAFSPIIMNLTEEVIGAKVNGLYITNATYTFLSVRDGDAFSKKFGGFSGDDHDYLRLTFKAYEDGQLKQDSVDFYLADYRFDDNSQDYIINEWTYLDLSSLGDVDSLEVSMISTDIGAFGMNTPAYFCVDHIETEDVLSAVYEIPYQDIQIQRHGQQLILAAESDFTFQVYNLHGQLISKVDHSMKTHQIDMNQWSPGIIIIKAEAANATFKTFRIVNY